MQSPSRRATENAFSVQAAQMRRSLIRWFVREGRDLPWRRTHDPYAIMVSEFMLQQTQVLTVIDYYRRWMERFPTLTDLANASEEEVLSIWQGLGYYARARNLLKTARVIAHEQGGHIPRQVTELQRLPGLGTYTAAAIASFAFDQRAVVIDANIARVLARLTNYQKSIDTSEGRNFLERIASILLPEKGGGRQYNSALMELGALICTARHPQCGICPVRTWCRATSPGNLPKKRPRKARAFLEDHVAFVRHSDGVGLEQVEKGRWQGLWRLPEVKGTQKRRVIFESTYAILHYQATLKVYSFRAHPSASLMFFHPDQIQTLPMPAPHRRAVEQLLDQPRQNRQYKKSP